MKHSNVICALGSIMMVAAYATASNSAQAGGIYNAGVYVNASVGALGVGTGYQGGLCGSPCSSSLGGVYGAQYAGLPAALPKQQIPLRVPMQPAGPSGWVNTGNGYTNGYPNGAGFNSGYPFNANGYHPGFANNGFNNGFNNGMPFSNFNAAQSPCNSFANNMRFAMPQQQVALQQIPGGPCGVNCGNGFSNGFVNGGGGNVVINARSPAAWEIADTGFIISATGGALMNMNSSVFPVGFPRDQQTIPEIPNWTGNRLPGFEARPGLQHNTTSIFQ